MSKQRTKAHAKRKRRKVPILTPEERVNLELARLAAEDRSRAEADNYQAMLVDCMTGEHYGSCRCQRSQLTCWERAELTRLNEGRHEPMWTLPDAAYEAVRLSKYCS